MNLGVFEDRGYEKLLPLTWLRACFELRCGRDRLLDKIQARLGLCVARLWVRETVREVVAARVAPAAPVPNQDWCLVNARAFFTGNMLLPPVGVAWKCGDALAAVGARAVDVETLTAEDFLSEINGAAWLRNYRIEPAPAAVRLIEHPWDLVLRNGDELKRQCRDGGVCEGTLHRGAHWLNEKEIHVAAGAVIKPGVVLDAEDGPIHIDRDAVIQPNAVLIGPCYVGPGSVIRPGAAIRENTSIGPICKVGGEIEGSIFHGYANKQHDGFLGHSYVGEWANLGADTVTSDLKNTYGTIRVSLNGVEVETGQRFIGSTIGDHAKTGIGTILPTGCILGVAANVFTTGLVPKFVPSFAWLTEAGMTAALVGKIIEIAGTVMGRRKVALGNVERQLLERTAKLARRVEAAGWE